MEETNQENKKDVLVTSVYGEITKDQFKETYKDVYVAVEKREHLRNGYIEYSTDLGWGPVTVRTLTKRDQSFISKWAPVEFITSSDKWTEDRMTECFQRYSDLMLIFCVEEFPGVTNSGGGSIHLHVAAPVGSVQYTEWAKNPDVKDKKEELDALPDFCSGQLSRLIADVTAAFNDAMVSLLKNQLTPQKQ